MMQKYKTAFLGNTVSKTKREKIMQNFNIQPCQFQYDSYLSWYKKIFKWPRVRWFYCFYIYYKKKKKERSGGREGGRNWSLFTKASSCQQENYFSYNFRMPDWLPVHPREIHLHISFNVSFSWKFLPLKQWGAFGTLLLLSPIWRKSALTLLSVPVTPRGTYSCRN